MTWVVDTCVLIDIFTNDPTFASSSAQVLNSKLDCPLAISPITYIELAPCFSGNQLEQDAFLESHWIMFDFGSNNDVVREAYHSWYRHVQRKRTGEEIKRPIADVLIGAYAKSIGGGLITRNEKHFKTLFPDLDILNPASMEQ
ncbi:MAG: type II toxin-antitoxin system VapC family toxin [Kiritimatiellae bacterium]|nr:type II toxin-antitoxin system VapC family toxin [Kiritimatiellia bacterium]